MQNKGFIRVFSIALALVCVFYLSFSVVTTHYSNKAKEHAQGDSQKYYNDLDSIAGEKVWLGYTLKECREKEINLGLDLKGGMNVTMELSVPSIVVALSDNNQTDIFKQAVENAKKKKSNDFLTTFREEFEKIDQNAKLSAVFSTIGLKDKIQLSSTNAQVINTLRNEVKSTIDNSYNVLSSRIDRFGVVQPNIQKIGGVEGRILVELPGIKEPERVRKLLQGSANLEFWETFNASELTNVMSQINTLLRDVKVDKNDADTTQIAENQTEAKAETEESVAGLDSLAQALKTAETAENVEQNDEKAMADFIKNNPLFGLGIHERSDAGPVLGSIAAKDTAKLMEYFRMPQVKRLLPRELSLRWTIKPIMPANKDNKHDRYGLIALKVTNRDGRAPLAGDVITDARTDFDQFTNGSTVSMKMNAEGATTWARLTEANKGKSIAISLDNYIYSYPRVNDKITGGSSQITGNFTPEEAKDLANVLKSGKMPAPAHIVQEDVVGPSLGQEAINKGLVSFAIALVLVFIYMIMYYRLVPGLIADVVLIANTFFMFGILASFNAVLTLPGIAGIVLSLGMAVDANVLIYERCREELASGKNLKKTIEEGFRNALSAILDGQITTLLIGIILFVFGTGSVKGFATTLIIGIFTSLFTSILFSRMLFERLVEMKKDWKISFTTDLTKNWFKGFNFDFIGKRKYGYIFSGVLCLVIIGSLFTNGLKEGIDFSGGNTYVVRFENKIDADEVREKLDDIFKGNSLYVITMGDANQIRISTNYVTEHGEAAENKIESMLYNGLKDYLNSDVTLEMFIKRYVKNNGVYELANLEKGENFGIQLSQSVGPTIASDMITRSAWAVLLSLLVMFVYILIRFKNYGYSVGATVSLAHDAFFMVGIYSLCYKFMPFSLDVDQAFIAAILTIIAYSVKDTVVIFDRVRENLTLYPKRDIKEQINNALNVTLSRTFSTSFAVMLTLVAMFVFGGEVIRGFMFALLMGTVSGVYSTLFIAAALAYDVRKKK
jgi:SecD/SecF fusion protein